MEKTWFCETVGCNGIFYQESEYGFGGFIQFIGHPGSPKIGIFSIGIGVRCAQFSGHLSDCMVVKFLRMWQMPWLHGYQDPLCWWMLGSLWISRVSLGCFHMLLMQKTKKTKRFHVSLVGQTQMKSCDSQFLPEILLLLLCYFCCCFATNSPALPSNTDVSDKFSLQPVLWYSMTL